MRVRLVGVLFLIWLVAGVSAEQQPSANAIARQDFSGTWTIGTASGPTPGSYEGRGNSPDGQLLVGVSPIKLVISRDGDKLRIEQHRQMFAMHAVEYGLNGQPAKTQFFMEPVRPAAPSVVTSKWEENTLVSTIDVVVPGESDPRHYIETISINPNGDLAVRIQRVGTADSRTLLYRKAK
jgi:hypothetical protein